MVRDAPPDCAIFIHKRDAAGESKEYNPSAVPTTVERVTSVLLIALRTAPVMQYNCVAVSHEYVAQLLL
jgi:hypothetical protein